MSLSRRSFLKSAIATAAGATALSACESNKNRSIHAKQLNIYSWPDYISPEAIPNFEKRYGIKVIYDTVSSNESLIAKLQAGAADYDIVVPSNYTVTKLRELNKLAKIDKERLSNYKHLMPRFSSARFGPESDYAVPYTFGTTGIAYNSKAPCFDDGALPDDWDAFWNPKIAGRMTILEDYRESFGFALKHRGLSYNEIEEAKIRLACDDLKGQKKYEMCFTSDQVITYLTSGDAWLSLAFSGDAQQAARSNPDVRYIIPKSGASMWVDNLCIPLDAPHLESAYLWINYMLEPEVSASLSNFTFYASPNAEARKYVNPNLLADKSLYPPDEILNNCEEIHDVGKAIFIYDRLWTELKCV